MTTSPVKAASQLFLEAANAHAIATETGDSKSGNQAHKQIMKAANVLRVNHAAHLLRDLLHSSDTGPRLWAATYLLVHENDSQAETILTEQALVNDIHGFTAEMILREWRAGRLKWT